MTSAKEKDRILAHIKAFKHHSEIVGIEKHLYNLEHDGYVRVWRNEQNRPITVRLTAQGKTFLESGGYSVATKRQLNATIRGTLSSTTGRIVEGVIIAILVLIVCWWIKDRYGISDSPECTEQKVLKNDSTFLSSASQSRLNEVNAASRGNSRELSLDSSKSTFDRADTGTSTRDTSAVHSSTRDESKAMPSGR